jgi:hypothetical protein
MTTKTSNTYFIDAHTITGRDKELENIAGYLSKDLGVEIQPSHLDYAQYVHKAIIKAKIIAGQPHIYVVAISGHTKRDENGETCIEQDDSGCITLRIPNVTGCYLEQYHPDRLDTKELPRRKGESIEGYVERSDRERRIKLWRWFYGHCENLEQL